MEWTTPEFSEIQLCCEINSYANAWLGKPEFFGVEILAR
jgi:coenzyme PQQ precursor peptide PqqA